MNIIKDGKLLRDSLNQYKKISLDKFLEHMYKNYNFEFLCIVYEVLSNKSVGDTIIVTGDFAHGKSNLIKELEFTFPHLYYVERQLNITNYNNANLIVVDVTDWRNVII